MNDSRDAGATLSAALREIEVTLATIFPRSEKAGIASNLPLEMRAQLIAIDLRSRGTWWIERSQRVEIERDHLRKDVGFAIEELSQRSHLSGDARHDLRALVSEAIVIHRIATAAPPSIEGGEPGSADHWKRLYLDAVHARQANGHWQTLYEKQVAENRELRAKLADISATEKPDMSKALRQLAAMISLEEAACADKIAKHAMLEIGRLRGERLLLLSEIESAKTRSGDSVVRELAMLKSNERDSRTKLESALGFGAMASLPQLADHIVRELHKARAESEALKSATIASAQLSAHFFESIERERDALREENDALKAASMEASEIYAETVNDLALALGTKLDPCSSGCPGHLPSEAVQKLKRLRAANDAKAKEASADKASDMSLFGIPVRVSDEIPSGLYNFGRPRGIYEFARNRDIMHVLARQRRVMAPPDDPLSAITIVAQSMDFDAINQVASLRIAHLGHSLKGLLQAMANRDTVTIRFLPGMNMPDRSGILTKVREINDGTPYFEVTVRFRPWTL